MITFDIEGRYKKLIIVDGKSYVMLGYDDKMTIKGNTLRSRSSEPVYNEMLINCCRYVFDEKPELIREEYESLRDKIEQKQLTPQEILKRENLNMSLNEYRRKQKEGNSPIAVYEAALNSPRPYSKGDVINTWVEEPEPVLKKYKTKEDKWVVPKGISSYLQIRNEKQFNGNTYTHHYINKLENAMRSLVVVLGYEEFVKMFPEISIRKPEQIKLIPVLGLDKFQQTFPKFKWNEKAFKKVSEQQRSNYRINAGKLEKIN